MRPDCLDEVEVVYWSVNSVMKKNPDMVRAYLGITREDSDDLRQELVRNLFAKSLPKWDKSKKVKLPTYLYSCSRNHLHNLTDKTCRRQRREKGMWEYWFTILDERADQGADCTYAREEGYRDTELISLVMNGLDLSDEEIALLESMSQEKTAFKNVAERMGCTTSKAKRIRRDLFKRIRIQYRIRK